MMPSRLVAGFLRAFVALELVAGAVAVVVLAGRPASSVGHGDALAGATVGYDGSKGQVIAFGGRKPTNDPICGDPALTPRSETWTWDGQWRLLAPARSPQARIDATAGEDVGRQMLVLYGGATTSGGCRLTKPCPSGSAPAGFTCSLGLGGITRDHSDTWLWDGTSWSEAQPEQPLETGPGIGQVMAWDAATGQLILVSRRGHNGSEVILRLVHDSTSVWDGHQWIEQSASAPQGPLAYDSRSRRLLSFVGRGAASGSSGGPPSSLALSQTWAWDGKQWSILHPAAVPDQAPAVIAADPATGGVVLFNSLGQTWIFDGSTWQRRHPTDSPPRNRLGQLVAVASHGLDLLVVGADTHHSDACWTWDGHNWHQIDAP